MTNRRIGMGAVIHWLATVVMGQGLVRALKRHEDAAARLDAAVKEVIEK